MIYIFSNDFNIFFLDKGNGWSQFKVLAYQLKRPDEGYGVRMKVGGG